jgi:hypothetical protein
LRSADLLQGGSFFFRETEAGADFVSALKADEAVPQRVSTQPFVRYTQASPDGKWWVTGSIDTRATPMDERCFGDRYEWFFGVLTWTESNHVRIHAKKCAAKFVSDSVELTLSRLVYIGRRSLGWTWGVEAANIWLLAER